MGRESDYEEAITRARDAYLKRLSPSSTTADDPRSCFLPKARSSFGREQLLNKWRLMTGCEPECDPNSPNCDPLPLLSELLLEGFNYEVVPLSSDKEFAVEINGHHDFYAPDGEIPSENTADVQVHDAFQKLHKYRHLTKFTPIGRGLAESKLSPAEIDERTDRLIRDKWDPRILWFENHMLFALLYVGSLEFRVHVYEKSEPEMHLIECHEQIWVKLIRPSRDAKR